MSDLRTLRKVAAIYEHEFRAIETARALRRVAARLTTPAEHNRELRRTLDEVLEDYVMISHGGHPHDYIDDPTATIRIDNGGIVITWSGFDPNDPEYGEQP